MPISNEMSGGLKGQIETEINQYLTTTVSVGETAKYSQNKLVQRINLFATQTYPNGKFDSQGAYKFWYEVIAPRIDSEVKNIDFDTKDISVYSERKIDELPVIITNLKIKDYLRETGQAEEINSAIEEGSGWGNVVWKKVAGGYERVDLKNFFVINQTAKSLKDSPAIERHEFSQSDLQAKEKSWDNIKEVTEECKSLTSKLTLQDQEVTTTTPKYDIYERNGEVCLKDLKETNGETVLDGDENKYTLAKVIGVGTKGNSTGVSIQYIMYAQKISETPYEEYHRSRYQGTWWRKGLYELLFDIQVRCNQIGNQISRGLEFASKKVLWSPDKLIVQNIINDINNGDIIRTTGLHGVDLRMDGFDQLAAEWNRLIALANEIANSREIVQGDAMPSGTPFRLGALYNQNANKLFDFIREKLAIPFSVMFEKWIIPELVKDIKAKDILRLTGDSDMMVRLYEVVVNSWYIDNLISLPPHTNEMAVMLKQQQMDLLKKRPQLLMKGVSALFEDFKPHACVVISGENSNKGTELDSYNTFIQLESDPIRRSYLVELAMKRVGIDVASLPRSTPEQLAGVVPQQTKVV